MRNNDKLLDLRRPTIFFLSFFGVGMLPRAPGTWGTLAAMPILYFMASFHFPLRWLLPMLMGVICLAIFVADTVQRQENVQDPGWIVIDEVIGVIVTWAIIPTNHWVGLLLIFFFFRFFDILKIWPSSWVDRSIKNGLGTILDDIVSGMQAAGVLGVIRHFFPQYFVS